jgi:hypothetical protein
MAYITNTTWKKSLLEASNEETPQLIASPLEWQTTAVPIPHPAIPVLAERGGTQLKTPRPVTLVDTREQNPFNFSRFEGWFAGERSLSSAEQRVPSKS